MAEAFAITDDVQVRWRPLTDAESTVAEALLADASDIIRVRYPDVDSRIAAGEIAAASVARVVANMVKRAMRVGDAEGFQTVAQTAGPFSVSGSVANPNANLFLNADDCLVFEGPTPRVRVGWL